MKRNRWIQLIVLPALLASLPAAVLAAEGKELTPAEVSYFEKKVRPILAQHCYECHAKDAAKIKGGLVLDSRAGWQAGGDGGEVIVPGNPDKSSLVTAVRYADEFMQMPPKYKLKDAEIEALAKWVEMGAPDPRDGKSTAPQRRVIDVEEGRDYWAFKPIADPKAPAVKDATWPRDDIDRFILAKLEAQNLKPVGDADRYALIRRASFDLIGLPPTPEEIDAFVTDSDPTPKAFAKVVDRLLASDQFGVRFGRHWLDVARYAESIGNSRNVPFPFAWRYRDYVIKSFNEDKPYDQFVMEQLAGDLLPAKSDSQRDEQRIGTTFLALGSHDLNERNNRQFAADVVDEQLDMTGRAFMALTLGCARCHDHKFDPIAQSDYTALAGIFYSTETRSGVRSRGQGANNNAYFHESLLVELAAAGGKGDAKTDANQKQIEQLQEDYDDAQKKVRQFRNEIKKLSKGKNKQKFAAEREEKTKAVQVQQKRLREVAAKLKKLGVDVNDKKNDNDGGKLSHTNYAMGVTDGKPTDARINIKGEPSDLGDEVARGFVRVATDPNAPTIVIDTEQSGRLQLAQWMARPENPLTARVMVNRVWHHLFGVGIVRTVDNFGLTGEQPTHPELLDHLATRFINEGWSTKKLIRSIMLSRTYMLAAEHDEANYAVEPDNRLLWRANSRRLEVEAIRDAMMRISGQLDFSHPGASPVMEYSLGELRNAENVTITEPHRSVYVPVVRGYLPEMWETFDFADPAEVKGARDVTTVAPQALFMMNNDFVLAQAKAAAKRVTDEAGLDVSQRIERAYLLALNRKPTMDELAKIESYVKSFDAGKSGEVNDAWTSVMHALFAGAEFRYVN